MSNHLYALYYVDLVRRGWQGTFDQLQAEYQQMEAVTAQRVDQLWSNSPTGSPGQQQAIGAHVAPGPRVKKRLNKWWWFAGGMLLVALYLGHGNPAKGLHEITSGARTALAWVVAIVFLWAVLAVLGFFSNLFDSDSRAAGRRLSYREKRELKEHRQDLKDARRLRKSEMTRRGLY